MKIIHRHPLNNFPGIIDNPVLWFSTITIDLLNNRVVKWLESNKKKPFIDRNRTAPRHLPSVDVNAYICPRKTHPREIHGDQFSK